MLRIPVACPQCTEHMSLRQWKWLMLSTRIFVRPRHCWRQWCSIELFLWNTGCRLFLTFVVQWKSQSLVGWGINKKQQLLNHHNIYFALQKLRHENLVNMIEVFRRKKRFFLVFEYLEHTILEELEARSGGGLGFTTSRKYIYQVLRALDFIHSNNVSIVSLTLSIFIRLTKPIDFRYFIEISNQRMSSCPDWASSNYVTLDLLVLTKKTRPLPTTSQLDGIDPQNFLSVTRDTEKKLISGPLVVSTLKWWRANRCSRARVTWISYSK